MGEGREIQTSFETKNNPISSLYPEYRGIEYHLKLFRINSLGLRVSNGKCIDIFLCVSNGNCVQPTKETQTVVQGMLNNNIFVPLVCSWSLTRYNRPWGMFLSELTSRWQIVQFTLSLAAAANLLTTLQKCLLTKEYWPPIYLLFPVIVLEKHSHV